MRVGADIFQSRLTFSQFFLTHSLCNGPKMNFVKYALISDLEFLKSINGAPNKVWKSVWGKLLYQY